MKMSTEYKAQYPILASRLKKAGAYISDQGAIMRDSNDTRFYEQSIQPAVYEVLGSKARLLKTLNTCTNEEWDRIWERAQEIHSNPPKTTKKALEDIRKEMLRTLGSETDKPLAEKRLARLAGDWHRDSTEAGSFSLPRRRSNNGEDDTSPRR